MQVICKKYMSNILGIKRARKAGRKDVRYPWKQKKNFNTIWDIAQLSVDYNKNCIRVSRPKTYNYKDKGGKIRNNPIYLKFKHKLPYNIVQIELIYNNGLQLAINYWIEEYCLQIHSNNICAVDFGEIHSITTVDLNGSSEIITGRQIRSIQRFRNKELGKLQIKLRKYRKGSKNYKRIRRTIRKLTGKSTRKIRDSVNKTAKLFSEYVILNNTNTVVVGNLRNFNMNLKHKKQGNLQKVVQWTHGQLLQKIRYNLEKYNVLIEEISEAYTSQTCPCCGNRYKPTSRNYICKKCCFTMHRDLVGAYNILSKYINNGEIKPLEIHIKPLKYLRI